jgi:hypothetical protein
MADGKTYWEKLQDPKWQRKRLEIFQRSQFKCEWCGSEKYSLQVHHGFYSGDPWEAGDDVLYCLCEHCHKWAEERKHDIRIELGRLHPKYHRSFFGELLRFREAADKGDVAAEERDWSASV